MTVTTEPLRSLGGSQSVYVNGSGQKLGLGIQGCIGQIIVLGTSTTTTLIHDNTAGGGTTDILFTVPANATVGTIYPVNCPFLTGVYVALGTGAALRITYNLYAP